MTADYEAIRQKAAEGVQAAVGELVTGWVVVATTITDEGESAAWVLTQPGQAEWTTLGLLEWASRSDSRGPDA